MRRHAGVSEGLPHGAPFVLFGLVAWFVSLPLGSPDIMNTQSNDLANHIRHVHEYGLALREGQWLPLVAPTLNGSTRIPLFQITPARHTWFPVCCARLA
jgi:hypothetical protein